jgi:UDP-3-O-[3-hydroxymyristoyl] glucosamine N-acyltransferase
MSEPLSFPRAVKTSLAEIAAGAGAVTAEGADLSVIITGVAPLDEAGPGELTILDSPQDAALLETSQATACFISPRHAPLVPQPMLALIVDEPYLGLARAIRFLFPQLEGRDSLFGGAGVNPGASLHPEARLEQDVIVDPGAVIGPRTEIGSGSVVGANSVIGADVRIGRHCLISPQVTISHALIGDRVIVHPGVCIGQKGILTAKPGTGLHLRNTAELPTVGRVIVQDAVEIGANSTIERGILSDTVLGEGTRIGSLVHVGTHVTLGRFCVIPSQVQIPPGARHEDFFSAEPK